MDFMLNFDQTEDLLHSFPLPCQLFTTQQQKADQQLPTKSRFGWRRKSSTANVNEDDNNPIGMKKRKIMHRDVERQRRQEMATLYASLRSLLPVEYLKGKRSISDHMHEALNYIKHLQNNIEELSNKRDSLRQMCNPSSSNLTMENSFGAAQDVVKVRPSCAGIEIIINTALKEGLPLSRVLQVLITGGLNIISCSSTKVKDRLFHTIQSEVDAGRNVDDLSKLQQKLMSLAN